MNPTTAMRPTIRPSGQRGTTLVEMMIAVTIGLLITGALSVLLLNISNANKEQFRAAQQIENGRFAMDLLQTDIRLAGYYGEFSALPAAPAALADPCTVPAEGTISTSTSNSPLAFYIQGYPAATLTSLPSIPAGCAAWLDSASVKPGSDIIVVRRLVTRPLVNPEGSLDPASGTQLSPVTTGVAADGQIYAQTTTDSLDVQYGDGDTITASYSGNTTAANLNAKGAASTLFRKDYTQAAAGSPPTRPLTSAYVRKLIVHVYYVSPCMKGSGSNGKCTSSDDTVPTLKRLELGPDGTTLTMNVVPLVEGIEFLKIRYGLDTSSAIAGQTLDGSVDSFVTAPATVSDWQNVVQADIRLVARNPEASTGYTDSKSYNLGSVTYTPSGDEQKFKRHTFASQVYIMNIGGRRES